MTSEITGIFAPRRKRHWGGFYTVDKSQCEAVLSTGDQLAFGYQGNGRKRVYYVTGSDGEALARSQQIYTSGWRSFINGSLRFTDISGISIMEITGRLFPTHLHFGETHVPIRNRYRKWFRYVLESDYFEFEQKGSDELRFIIKQPRFLLPSLCYGYLEFVQQSDNTDCGGG